MVNACAQVGDVQRATAWLGIMQDAGVEPDAVTYASVIHACAQNGDVQGAATWLTRMQDAGLQPNRPNAIVYNEIFFDHGWSSRSSCTRPSWW